jgi:protein TonB
VRACLGLSLLLLLSGCTSPPPPPKAPKSRADGPRITIGGPVDGCKLIRQVRAVYPKDAKKKRIQGTIRFNVLITKTGEPRILEVLKGGDPQLIAAALKAVEQWRDSPCRLNSEPVEVKTIIDINFTLNQ